MVGETANILYSPDFFTRKEFVNLTRSESESRRVKIEVWNQQKFGSSLPVPRFPVIFSF